MTAAADRPNVRTEATGGPRGGVEEQRVEAGGLSFTLTCAGPPDAPAVLLVGGFPDGRRTWHAMLARFAERGPFRACAADPPGLGDASRLSEAPSAPALAHAMAALCRRLDAVMYVGHDWGGVAGWALAAIEPDAVARVAIVNAPHPRAYRDVALRNPIQLARGAYMTALAAPLSPRVLGLASQWVPRRLMARWAATSEDPDDRARFADDVKATVGSPDQMGGAATLYRAALTSPLRRDGLGGFGPVPSSLPFLLVHGAPDPVFEQSTMDRSIRRYAPHGEYVRIDRGGHFPHRAAPGRVAEALAAFAAAQTAPNSGPRR